MLRSDNVQQVAGGRRTVTTPSTTRPRRATVARSRTSSLASRGDGVRLREDADLSVCRSVGR